MSVRVVDRAESSMEFLKVARDIECYFVKMMAGRPKRYRFFYSKIIESAMEILNHVKRGNSIYVETKADAELRMQEFKLAEAEAQVIGSQMEVIYYLFKDEGISIKQIEDMTKLLDKECALLKGLLKSDRERYKNLS